MTKKLGFFPQRELHIPILMPIFKELSQLGMQCYWVIMPHRQASGNIPEEGIHDEIAQSLRQEYLCIDYQLKLKFDLTLTADFVLDYTEEWGTQCCIGHGTISKNIYFLAEEICWRESFHELLVVPGPAYLENFQGQVKTQILPLGFPKFDYLYNALNKSSELQKSLRHKLNWDPQQKILLFAPTFNDEFQSMDLIYPNIQLLLDQGFNIIIKLHGAVNFKWKSRFEKLAVNHPEIYYSQDLDISESMAISDLMISDLSSVCLEFYLTYKPILVYNNPRQTESSSYNTSGMEFKYRSASYEFNDIQGLINVLTSLKSHDPKLSQRFRTADELFPSLNGNVSKKIAETIFQKIHSPELRHPHQIKVKVKIIGVLTPNSKATLIEKSYFPIHWIENDEPGMVLHWDPKEELPHHWDLKWQMSQIFSPQKGRISFLTQDNIEATLGMNLPGDEIYRQKFLSYKGFSRFLKSQGRTSLSYITNHGTENWTWLGGYIKS